MKSSITTSNQFCSRFRCKNRLDLHPYCISTYARTTWRNGKRDNGCGGARQTDYEMTVLASLSVPKSISFTCWAHMCVCTHTDSFCHKLEDVLRKSYGTGISLRTAPHTYRCCHYSTVGWWGGCSLELFTGWHPVVRPCWRPEDYYRKIVSRCRQRFPIWLPS